MSLERLGRKLLELDESFAKKGITKTQIEAYAIGLDDLTEHEIEIGCNRALRQWDVYSALPPPSYIRECACAALEEERNYRPRVKEFPIRRLTLDEAWEDWEYVQRVDREIRAQLGIVEKKKKAELKKTYEKDLVLYTRERMEELKSQQKFLETKYGRKK
jgi:hypothetical protein